MIRITSVEARDAFSFRHQLFKFERGLHRITGLNGSSKTSVFMTLIHCLANKNPKDCKVDDVSNKITKQPYHIEVCAEKGDDSYRFVNSKKTGTVEIWKNGKDISLTRIPDNLKLIQGILEADFTLLCDLLYQSKDSTLDLLETGTDRGRKIFINRVLKLAEIDEQAARFKEKEKDLAGKNGRRVFLEREIETLESALGEVLEVGSETDIGGIESEIQDVEKEVADLTGKSLQLEAKIHEIHLQIATAEGEQETRRKIAELEAGYQAPTLSSTEEAQRELEDAQDSIQDLKIKASELRSNLIRAEKAKEQLEILDEHRAALAKLGKPDKEKGECQEQLEKINRVHATTNAKLDEVQRKLVPYRKAVINQVCPTCGSAENWEQIQQLIADLEVAQEEHEALIAKCEAGQEKYRQRLNHWERRERIEAEIGKLSMIVPTELDIPVAQQRLRSYEQKIAGQEEITARNKALISEYHQAEGIAARIRTLKASLKGVEVASSLYQEEDECTAQLAWADANQKAAAHRLQSLQTKLSTTKEHNAIIRARKEVNRQIAEKNVQLQLQISQSKKELGEIEQKLDCIKEWNGILGNKGFRVARIRKFLKSLNGTMVKYSQMICDGRIKVLFFTTADGEVEFTISDAAKEMGYPLWSGGEKARVRLICLFAVLELLEVMGSVSFNVLCLDEIFDALDADGKDGLFKVLEYLKQKGKAVYVIAHSELALDLMYDTVVEAVKYPDGTTAILT